MILLCVNSIKRYIDRHENLQPFNLYMRIEVFEKWKYWQTVFIFIGECEFCSTKKCSTDVVILLGGGNEVRYVSLGSAPFPCSLLRYLQVIYKEALYSDLYIYIYIWITGCGHYICLLFHYSFLRFLNLLCFPLIWRGISQVLSTLPEYIYIYTHIVCERAW